MALVTKTRASVQLNVDNNVSWNSKKITDLANPTNANDAVNKAYVDALLDFKDAFQYKGILNVNGSAHLPTADAGHTYRIGGTGGDLDGKTVATNDIVECIKDGWVTGSAWDPLYWHHIPYNSSTGGVTGPGSSTDNAIARYDGATGQIIQNSNVTIDDNGSVNIPAGQTYKINGTSLNATHVGAEPTLAKGNLTASGVLSVTGGTNAVIGTGASVSITQAGSSTNGYLSSTDWNTFNNKQATITKANLTTTTTGVTIGGTGKVVDADITVNIQNATAGQPGLMTKQAYTDLYEVSTNAPRKTGFMIGSASATSNQTTFTPSAFTKVLMVSFNGAVLQLGTSTTGDYYISGGNIVLNFECAAGDIVTWLAV